ncbi:hypothetical protein GA0116948_102272 [Chitinophaga costaii]|uniref:Uncharacterized protein n=1 Tax=Chitinophaga costaii TaxID=1335309 RepID=A0A1C4AT00_9BACT|nr:hypothetical protein GA0116948_102272 [Chitinophaga costaii]
MLIYEIQYILKQKRKIAGLTILSAFALFSISETATFQDHDKIG